MALNKIFKDMMKQEGHIVKPLEKYLLKKNKEKNDRAVNVNAPSQIGKCMRANYYARMQYENDGTLSPRALRIFANGHGVHDRIQQDLLDCKLLLMDEVPILNDELNIQGHTDGFLNLGGITTETIKKGKFKKLIKVFKEIAILEIKSINDNGFKGLKSAKEDHILQGMDYLFCTEDRRLYLRETYKTETQFQNSKKERTDYFRSKYQHIEDGSKYTKEEKIENQVKINLKKDDILYHTINPVTKIIFLYENKNDQDLKEFVVEWDYDKIEYIIDYCKTLNDYVQNKKIPEREGTGKSCSTCRWCDYKLTCWR